MNHSAGRATGILLLCALAGGAAPAAAGVDALETQDLRLLYRPVVHEALAPHTARCFENALRFYRRVFRYEPSEKTTVILDDAYDFNNGAAFAAPRNTIVVQIAPAVPVYETLPSNERINHTMNHELAHIVALDRASSGDRFFRRVFCGKPVTVPEHPETIVWEYLAHPRFAAPRWYHEGMASFLETWLAGGIGRAQGAYDEMVFRSMVRDGVEFYDPLGLESEGTKVEFQAGAMSYLYGTRFVTWLSEVFSPDSVVAWTARTDGSKGSYAREFRRLFGMSLDDGWKRWVEWEHGFQRANLDSLQLHPLTPVRDFPVAALGSLSRPYLDRERGLLYAGTSAPGVMGRIAAISLADGKVETICDVKGAALYFVTSLAWDPASTTLFYTGDNAAWRDLYAVDPRRGESRRLMRDVRIGDLVFDSTRGELWGVRHFNGISTLVRIPAPYNEWHQVHSWPYGKDIYDLDVSPDGRWLSFSMSEIDGRQSLRMAATDELGSGGDSSRELYDFGATVPANFVFSPDGRFLYGSSYYTGVSNVWRYDLGRDSMQVVSNCETGLFRPLPVEGEGDSLLVFRYSGRGFVPAAMHAEPLEDVSAVTFLGARVAEDHPVVQSWNVGSPARVQLDSMTTYQGAYRELSSIEFESIYPVVEGYKDFAAVGLRASLSDPGFTNAIDLTTSFSPSSDLPDEERLHAALQYRRPHWTGSVRWNDADFYDLFGPTKRSRKGWALGIEHDRRLIDDRPRTLELEVATALYLQLETLPNAQNIAASSKELWASSLELRDQNVRRSIGAVDEEKGWRWRTTIENNYAAGKAFPIFSGGIDLGHPLLASHSALWWRNAAGWSPGPRNEPFANFFFGGFGNNWLDRRDEKRYREQWSFPGTELNEVGGTNFVKSLCEWDLPPWRFQHLGTASLYATWIRPAVFATFLGANLDAGDHRRTLWDAGAQVDLRFTLLSRLAMTFSFGYAAALEPDRRRSDEWMISLKVL